MKHYVALENGLSFKLKPKELFVYSVMLSTTNKNNETDITIEQISNLSGIPFKTIETEILPKLKKANVFEIIPFRQNNLNRNKYLFTYPEKNFRIIQTDFLMTKNLSSYQKGFMIAVYMQAFNNSLLCGLSYSKIIEKIKLSNKTFYKYLKELIELGYMIIINPANPDFEYILEQLDIPVYDYTNSSIYLDFKIK